MVTSRGNHPLGGQSETEIRGLDIAMTTLVLTHRACMEHDTGTYHPEHPARLGAALKGLEGDRFDELDIVEAPRAERENIELAHPPDHVGWIMSMVPGEGHQHLDPDTVLSPKSGEAALRAVGAACAAVDAVVGGLARNAFCAVRPPGHHAEAARAMGFCLFNSAAIAALYARARHGLERVAVVDFDVHHGNGTQDIFWQDRDLFYGSTHQMPLYPGTGSLSETGVGNIFNAPLAPFSGSEEFRAAMTDRILPALRTFGPDLIVVSAGFDAHKDDPLGGLNLIEDDFVWITRELLEIADKECGGRVVSTMEGGYNLTALAASVGAHVGALMDG